MGKRHHTIARQERIVYISEGDGGETRHLIHLDWVDPADLTDLTERDRGVLRALLESAIKTLDEADAIARGGLAATTTPS